MTINHTNSAVPEAVQKKITTLRLQLDEHNYHYYIKNSPLISDAEFDRLFRELQNLEEKYPACIIPESPTQRVGITPQTEFIEAMHLVPMLSLDNAFTDEEVEQFDRRLQQRLQRESLLGKTDVLIEEKSSNDKEKINTQSKQEHKKVDVLECLRSASANLLQKARIKYQNESLTLEDFLRLKNEKIHQKMKKKK